MALCSCALPAPVLAAPRCFPSIADSPFAQQLAFGCITTWLAMIIFSWLYFIYLDNYQRTMIYPLYLSPVTINPFHFSLAFKSQILNISPKLAPSRDLGQVWSCPWSNKIAELDEVTQTLWYSIFSIFVIDLIQCFLLCPHYPTWIYFAALLYPLVLELGVFWSASSLFHLCKIGSFWLRLAGTWVLGRAKRYILLSWRTSICTWNKNRWELFTNQI